VDGREPECLSRRRYVAADVRDFELALRRGDLEGLHSRRHDHAGCKGDEYPQSGSDGGKRQAALVDVEHHQHEDRESHHREQLDRRQAHVHIGVAGPVHVGVLRQDEVEAVDVEVARRPYQCHHPEDHRHVSGDARVHPRGGALEPQATVEVVGDAREDQDHEQSHERPVDKKRQEGQLEHVETDGLVELRVRHTEGLAAAEKQPVLPLVARRGTHDEGEDQRDDRAQRERVPADDLLVAADDLELGRDEQSARGDAVDHPEARPTSDEERAHEHRGDLDLGLDQEAPDRREADRPVPEVVRVEVGQSLNDDQRDDDEDHGANHPGLVPPARAHPGR
jgi:hypothetical protein